MSTLHTLAMVKIQAEIASGSASCSNSSFRPTRGAFEDKGCKPIVLSHQFARGSPAQAEHRQLTRFTALRRCTNAGDAVVEETARRPPTYIASAPTNPTWIKASAVGSIGVLDGRLGFTGLMDKLGVERRPRDGWVKAGFCGPVQPQPDKQRVYAQAMPRTRFTSSLLTWPSWGASAPRHPETFSGLFWTGQQAIDMGPPDHLGNPDYGARGGDPARSGWITPGTTG